MFLTCALSPRILRRRQGRGGFMACQTAGPHFLDVCAERACPAAQAGCGGVHGGAGGGGLFVFLTCALSWRRVGGVP